MKGYLFAEIEITDPGTYKQYMPLAAAAIAGFGGRYLVRGGNPEVLEGDRNPKRVVVLEFETIERAQEFYHSPQYQAAAAVRRKCARGHFYLLRGAAADA